MASSAVLLNGLLSSLGSAQLSAAQRSSAQLSAAHETNLNDSSRPWRHGQLPGRGSCRGAHSAQLHRGESAASQLQRRQIQEKNSEKQQLFITFCCFFGSFLGISSPARASGWAGPTRGSPHRAPGSSSTARRPLRRSVRHFCGLGDKERRARRRLLDTCLKNCHQM